MRAILTQERDNGVGRVFALILDTGDEVIASITDFAEENAVSAAHFTAIGALSSVTLAWFDMAALDYKHTEVRQQVEVASLVGNIALYEGKPKVHTHLVVGKEDGSAMAGHLIKGSVRPTLEIFVTELTGHLERQKDEETGLPLIRDA